MKSAFIALSLILSAQSMAATRLLICDGDVSFYINPAERSLTVVEEDGSEAEAEIKKFDVLRCPNCFRIEGSVETSEGEFGFRVATRGQGFNAATASVEVRDLATGETGTTTAACVAGDL